MSRLRDKRRFTRRRGALVAVSAVVACLALSGTAVAGQDQLKGGSVEIQLQGSRGLKLSPTSLSLQITGGQVDPVDGSGTVQVSGAFRAKRGKAKTRVTITALLFGASGGQGSVTARVGKKSVSGFGTLAGGTVTRDGFGAKIEKVRASLGRNGAKALARALEPRHRKGAKSAAGGGIRAGQSLGTVSATTVPQTVEVVPGSGTMSLDTPLAFANKLSAHCIDALSGGAAPIPPAMQSTTTFTFPVSGGALAPDFSDGKIQTAGGQTITKNNGPSTLLFSGCMTNPPPVGTAIVQTDFAADLGLSALTAHAMPPGTDLGVAAIGSFDTSGATMTLDPSTKQVTISNVTVNLAPVAADVLNNLFPNQSGNASNDFSTNDSLGTLDVTAKLR
jgi:hypothetical protein